MCILFVCTYAPVCVCVCVCACVRACVRACARVCVCVWRGRVCMHVNVSSIIVKPPALPPCVGDGQPVISKGAYLVCGHLGLLGLLGQRAEKESQSSPQDI